MKKSKLSIGLVASFVAALGMSSCSSVKSSDKNILSFNGYDGKTYSIVTDDMYAEYQTTENITKFYNQILEVMIRSEFDKEDSPLAARKSYVTIKQEAENKVKDEKQKAEDSTDSYSTAWEAILDSYGVETEKELLEHFIYDGEKEVAEEWYYDDNELNLTKEYIGVKNDGSQYTVSPEEYSGGKFNSKYPYHIRHILVKTSGNKSEYTVDTISEDNAKKLASVVSRLTSAKETFGMIAFSESDDGSASKYGDVGVMTNAIDDSTGKLQMVNEFQLGIYAFDTLFGANKGKAQDFVKNALGVKGVENQIKSESYAPADSDTGSIKGLTRVPASVFEELGKYSEIDTDKDGYNLADGKEQIFPRNILWNKYLNRHNPFIITNNDKFKETSDDPAVWAAEDFEKSVKATSGAISGRYVSAKALKIIGDEATDFGVLCDENKNPIIGVRSEFGIHFMIIQKSVLDFNDGSNGKVSLEEYYTTLVPSDKDFPSYNGKKKLTYVNYMNTTTSDYRTRSDELKDKIKSYDTTYEYRLYETLLKSNKDRFSFGEAGKKLIENIDNYIAIQRESKIRNQEVGMDKVWDEYLEMITLQNDTRANAKRRIPEGCIIGFDKKWSEMTETEKEAWTKAYSEGGVCYYGKK